MRHDVRDNIVEYVYVIVGAAVIAIGFNVFYYQIKSLQVG